VNDWLGEIENFEVLFHTTLLLILISIKSVCLIDWSNEQTLCCCFLEQSQEWCRIPSWVLYFRYAFWKLQKCHVPPSLSCASMWWGDEQRIMHVFRLVCDILKGLQSQKCSWIYGSVEECDCNSQFNYLLHKAGGNMATQTVKCETSFTSIKTNMLWRTLVVSMKHFELSLWILLSYIVSFCDFVCGFAVWLSYMWYRNVRRSVSCWMLIPCQLVMCYRRFKLLYCLHHLGQAVWGVRMKASQSFETPATVYWMRWCSMSEELTL
jgi:hypothetical protein